MAEVAAMKMSRVRSIAGLTLELRVTPADGPFTSVAHLKASGTIPDETWEDHEIRPGPKFHRLVRREAYMLTVLLTFFAAAEAEVYLCVRDDDGNVRVEERIPVQGTAGTVKRVVRLIFEP